MGSQLTITIEDPVNIEVTIPKNPFIHDYFGYVLNAGTTVILFSSEEILGMDCVDSCSLFHSNSVYPDPNNGTIPIPLSPQWGISDGNSASFFQPEPKGRTLFEFVLEDQPPEGTFSFTVACLVPITGC